MLSAGSLFFATEAATAVFREGPRIARLDRLLSLPSPLNIKIARGETGHNQEEAVDREFG